MTENRRVNRRDFLIRARGLTATAIATGTLGLPSLLEIKSAHASQGTGACDIEAPLGQQRVRDAFEVRVDAALHERDLPHANHLCNSSEQIYPNKIANYCKGLPHNDRCEVDLDAYNSLLNALTTGNQRDFEAIQLGSEIRLANPQAALAFELEGPDSHRLTISSAPAFDSAEQASEMGELYWHALARDVPFLEYGENSLTVQAATDLSRFSDFRGPKSKGQVTGDTLFRGNTPGDWVGPYISQFLWMDIPFGAQAIKQQIRTTAAQSDFMIRFYECMAIQNGERARASVPFDSTPRYIRNGRDLGEYVHRDFTYQAFLNAALILLGMGAPLAQGNPYKNSRTQSGFSTFGSAHILHVVALVANLALRATWFQKWMVHRRLRPEEFGVHIHTHLAGPAVYPIHPDLTAVSPVLHQVFNYNRAREGVGSYLLPQAYPEGSPMHPSYPAGHAAVAGACATVLKAFFDETFVLPDPVVASSDGLSLQPYVGGDLTVRGELNKLASNIACGRNFAGIHWRSDGKEGMRLGEAVAMSVLAEMKPTFNEEFSGFTFTQFDGTRVNL